MAVSNMPTPGVTPGPQWATQNNAAIQTRYLDALRATDEVSDLISGQFPQPNTRKLIGPVTSDLPTVNLNIAPAGLYNQSYVISGGALPAGWPVDSGDAPIALVSNYIFYQSLGFTSVQPRTFRFMCDGTRVALAMNSSAGGQLAWGDFFLFIDGAPVSLAAYDPAAGNQFCEFVFASAKPRLYEILTCGGLNAVYCAKPYRVWAPQPSAGPKVLLVGDSYTQGVTTSGGTLGAPTYGDSIQGFASKLGLEMGVARWSTDGIGGTGYIKTNGGANNYNDRRASHIARNPDVLIVGGGGANDLLAGANTVAQIVAAATTYFTQVRASLPNCKLVFLEGFAPPVGFSTFGPSYIAIRQQLQAALVNIGVYYVDIATSSAWIDGVGYVGATTGVGNSDLYVGNDGAHLSPAGQPYVLKRLAPKLRTIIADTGALVNTLV